MSRHICELQYKLFTSKKGVGPTLTWSNEAWCMCSKIREQYNVASGVLVNSLYHSSGKTVAVSPPGGESVLAFEVTTTVLKLILTVLLIKVQSIKKKKKCIAHVWIWTLQTVLIQLSSLSTQYAVNRQKTSWDFWSLFDFLWLLGLLCILSL